MPPPSTTATVTFTAATMGLVNAGLAVALAFGVTLTNGQTAAITGMANALLVFGAVCIALYSSLRRKASGGEG